MARLFVVIARGPWHLVIHRVVGGRQRAYRFARFLMRELARIGDDGFVRVEPLVERLR